MAKKTAPASATTPEVLDVAENVDLQQTKNDGVTIGGFLRNLVPFFTRATELEQRAQEHLDIVKALTAPTSEAEDVAMQEVTRQSSAHIKEIQAHWEISSIVHRFQRRLASARDRAVNLEEQAKTISNNHHNRYAEAERRRAAEETERQRLAKEQEARDRQAEEARKLEDQAVALEQSSPDLSEREERFVDGVVANGDPVQSARQAGYKDYGVMAARLMASEKIKKAIEAKQAAKAARQQATAVKSQPVQVDVEPVRANVGRAAGGHDRTTWGYEVVDERAFVDAAISGRHGIPSDTLTFSPAKLGEYARSLHERIDLWPGVRHTKKTTTV